MKIINDIIAILFDLSGSKNINLEHELQGDLGLDSLQMITLLIMVEDKFNILLDEADMNPFDLITVSNVVDLVKKYVGGDINEENS